MHVSRLDHLVLTVKDLPETVGFYERLLGMRSITFGEGRTALTFGDQKINLHPKGSEIQPRAHSPTPGSSDLCFILDGKLEEFVLRARDFGVRIIEGPVKRTGALGAITSVYLRDPDENLIEVSIYDSSNR